MVPLEGKTALVTGGARRIGRATAEALATEGANVAIHYGRSRDEAEEAAAAIRKAGPQAWTIQADMADPSAAEALLPREVETAGPIHFLVNNASIFEPSLVTDFSTDDLARNVQINAMSPLLLSRAFAEQGVEGAIVNLLDSRIVEYDKKNVAYHLSKRMLFSLTRMTAMEFAPAIRVNGVGPGLILPPEGEDDSYVQRLAHLAPLGRVISVEAVVEAVMYLLKAEHVTGQVLFVDGGRHMRANFYG